MSHQHSVTDVAFTALVRSFCLNNALHMFAIVCAREELSCFTSQVGVGSKEQYIAEDSATIFAISAMILAISAGVTGLNTSKITASGVLSVDC